MICDASTGKVTATLTGHQGAVQQIVFQPAGDAVASLGADGAVRIWDLETGDCRVTLPTESHGVGQGSIWLSFSPDGRVLTTTAKGRSAFWNVAQGTLLAAPDWLQDAPVCLGPDGNTVAAAINGTRIRLGDLTRDVYRDSPTVHWQAIDNLTFTPDGKLVASASWGTHCVGLTDTAQGKEIGFLRRGESSDLTFDMLSFSPDSRLAAVFTRMGQIYLFDVPRRRFLGRLLGHRPNGYSHIAFSPDGKRMLSARTNDTYHCLWAFDG